MSSRLGFHCTSPVEIRTKRAWEFPSLPQMIPVSSIVSSLLRARGQTQLGAQVCAWGVLEKAHQMKASHVRRLRDCEEQVKF